MKTIYQFRFLFKSVFATNIRRVPYLLLTGHLEACCLLVLLEAFSLSLLIPVLITVSLYILMELYYQHPPPIGLFDVDMFGLIAVSPYHHTRESTGGHPTRVHQRMISYPT